MPLVLFVLLTASATPLKLPAYERALEAQIFLHARLNSLPWTAKALEAMLPSECNDLPLAKATSVPLGASSPGTTVQRTFDRGLDGRVDLMLVDLAGMPNEEVRRVLEGLKSVAQHLSSAPGKTRPLELTRPTSRTVGLWHQSADGGVALGRWVVGGRFVVGVEGHGPHAARKARACWQDSHLRALLKNARPTKH